MSDPIRVAVVDDHPLFRDGVLNALERSAEFTVVGQGASCEEAIQLATDHLPDIILLDVTMPGGGIAAARKISASCPVTRIVMLTVSQDHHDLVAAFEVGARGYVIKGVSGSELMRVLRSIHEGNVYVEPALAGGILLEMASGSTLYHGQSAVMHDLTDTEVQILELLAGGRTNREIGAELHLAEKTIKNYMTNILEKLQVRSRVEAALLAQKSGLLDSDA